LHFGTTALFHRVSATAHDQRDRAQNRHGLHLLILGSERFIARNQSEPETHRVIEPELLLQAYRLGVFPMAMEDDSIQWFSPDPRAILPLDEFHVPHALRRVADKKVFECKIDNRFSEVIRACAKREDTWINREIIESYENLHELGFAHSVEAWSEGKLAGGLYGVAVGGAFFGESMFHRKTDASKIALLALVQHLRARKFLLLDTQWITPHLAQFGAVEISRDHYLTLLARALDAPRKFLD
jgi:leucyl/phenylalanyl-tRNA--protein transferase